MRYFRELELEDFRDLLTPSEYKSCKKVKSIRPTWFGRYYHASGERRAESRERRAVIWRAVSDEKPIIVKDISYFRNYY